MLFRVVTFHSVLKKFKKHHMPDEKPTKKKRSSKNESLSEDNVKA